jgi:hypothetical protein
VATKITSPHHNNYTSTSNTSPSTSNIKRQQSGIPRHAIYLAVCNSLPHDRKCWNAAVVNVQMLAWIACIKVLEARNLKLYECDIRVITRLFSKAFSKANSPFTTVHDALGGERKEPTVIISTGTGHSPWRLQISCWRLRSIIHRFLGRPHVKKIRISLGRKPCPRPMRRQLNSPK